MSADYRIVTEKVGPVWCCTRLGRGGPDALLRRKWGWTAEGAEQRMIKFLEAQRARYAAYQNSIKTVSLD